MDAIDKIARYADHTTVTRIGGDNNDRAMTRRYDCTSDATLTRLADLIAHNRKHWHIHLFKDGWNAYRVLDA